MLLFVVCISCCLYFGKEQASAPIGDSSAVYYADVDKFYVADNGVKGDSNDFGGESFLLSIFEYNYWDVV